MNKERRFYQLAYYGHNDRRGAKHSYPPAEAESDDSSVLTTALAIGEAVGDLLGSIADSTGDSTPSTDFGGFEGGESGGAGASGDW